MCRSRRELSNEHLLAKIGVDKAENEPLEVWGENYSILFIRVLTGESKQPAPAASCYKYKRHASSAEDMEVFLLVKPLLHCAHRGERVPETNVYYAGPKLSYAALLVSTISASMKSK